MTDAAAGDDGVDVLGAQHALLVIFVDGAFVGHEEAGADLHALGAQHEGRRNAAPVADAARGKDGDFYRVHHLGHKRHGGQVADVAAGFAAL